MSHGLTRIPSRGACIYCGAGGVKLTDEHVIPLSLGGFHILEGASCKGCADITTKFERDVAREMWGDARNSYNVPSRRKKERKNHVFLTDPDNPGRRVKVPYSEYPAAMVFYKMGRAGLLEGLPDTVDVSNAWQVVAISDREKAKQFQEKWGVPLTSRFRHVPDSFARLLAKIGYCNLLCALEPGDFRPICLPYILGTKPSPSYVVGGTLEIAEPNPGLGYVMNTAGFIRPRTRLCRLAPRLIHNRDADQLEAAADQAIAACGSDAREAVKALIVANQFLETDLAKLKSAVSMLGCHAEAITTPAVQSAQTLPPGDGKGETSLAHFTGSVAKPDEEDGALKFKRSLLERAFRKGGRASGKESCVHPASGCF